MSSSDIRHTAGFLLLAIVCGFVIYWSLMFFDFTFSDNLDFLSSSIGAFGGAFFAFLFIRLGDFLTRIYNRQRDHYNALVRFEHYINSMLGIMADNRYLIPDFQRVISEGNVSWNYFNELPFDEDFLEQLYDNEYTNDMLSLLYDIRKINDDIKTLNRAYSILQRALIQQHMGQAHYIDNTKQIAGDMGLLDKFLEATMEKSIVMLGKTRILIELDKPFGTRIMHFLLLPKVGRIKEKRLNTEIEKLRGEIEKIASESRAEKDKILKSFKEGQP